MLHHTKQITMIYERVQKKLYYMIPEKWDALYLYSSVLDEPDNEGKTGELFFYYIPKGILKKRPVNVYEIPMRFNIDEKEYLSLVEMVYQDIKELRKEFKKTEKKRVWSNVTITIKNAKFKVEYDYSDLIKSEFTSYERHVIWRYEILGIGPKQVSKKDREILNRHFVAPDTLARKEYYEAGIYIEDVDNIIAYSKEEQIKYNEHEEEEEKIVNKNQILLMQEQIEKKKEAN